MTFDGRTYRAQHDYTRLSNALKRVRWIMADYGWHSLTELRERVGPSADSRLGDLRKQRFGGNSTESRRCGEGGTWEYRLEEPLPVEVKQGGLF